MEPEAISIYVQYMDLYDEQSDESFKKLVQTQRKYMICDLGGRLRNVLLNILQ